VSGLRDIRVTGTILQDHVSNAQIKTSAGTKARMNGARGPWVLGKAVRVQGAMLLKTT